MSTVKITPIGGLGAFGMNCAIYEQADTRLMVDCGVLFPSVEHYGVDLLVPDFRSIGEQGLTALFVTHAHEDHHGAVPYLVKYLAARDHAPLEVYGTRFTLALVRRKLDRHSLAGAVEYKTVEAGSTVPIGDFHVDTCHVNHSVPEPVAIRIRTSEGHIVHTGDWRCDFHHPHEAAIDLARLAKWGEEGVRVLFADSTNAGVKGHTKSESVVMDNLEDVLDASLGRVYIALFSSNVWRMQAIVEAARNVGRKVALFGRGLGANFRIAQDLGMIPSSGDVLIAGEDLKRHPRDEVVAIVAGTQGEPQSNLTRAASGDHPHLPIETGDVVVFSARAIPGNEKPIGKVIDSIRRLGGRVIQPNDRPIHASGHAKQEEVDLLLQLIKPDVLVPAHGDFQQLDDHRERGEKAGIKDIRLIENGNSLEVTKGEVTHGPNTSLKPVYVEGHAVGVLNDEILRQRRQIGFVGTIHVSVVLDAAGRVVHGPAIEYIGIGLDPTMTEAAEDAARSATDDNITESVEVMSEAIRKEVRAVFRKGIGRKPLVVPVVVQLDPLG